MSITLGGASAHPGNKASDGCHYCRTNCDKWGVAWNQRHCHGGTLEEKPPVQIYPTNTPYPTRKPTSTYKPKPTKKVAKKVVKKTVKKKTTPTPKH